MADTPELDLNKFSTEDLIALKSGDLNKVSTEGLLMLKGAQPTPKTTTLQPDVPLVASQMPKQVPVAEPKRGMMDYVKALGEVPATLASGAIAQPVGAAYGIAKGILGPKTQQAMQQAQQAGGELAQKLQYQPISPASVNALEFISGALETAKIPPYLGAIGVIPSAIQKTPNVRPVIQESVMPTANRMAGALRNEGQMIAQAAQPIIEKVAQVAAPVTNKMAETLRMTPSIVKTAPTSEKLLEQSKNAFTTAKESGMQFNPEKFSTKMAEIGADLRKEGYTKPPTGETDPYAKITGALRNLTDVSNPKDFEELATLRTIIRNGQKSGDSTERKFATILKDKFDDYVLNAPKEDVIGNTKEGAEAWKTARDTWSRLSKSEVFEDMLNKSEINASKVGTEKYLHNKLLELSNSEKKMRLFTPTEQKAIQEAAKGGKIQNILKMAGKYSPESVVATATGSYVGAQMLGPAGAVIAPILGGASKVAATQIRKNDVNKLAALMRAGTPKGVGNE
jgi:peptidoglycan hydrolase-like protein with peptidoglycan-binding domain